MNNSGTLIFKYLFLIFFHINFVLTWDINLNIRNSRATSQIIVHNQTNYFDNSENIYSLKINQLVQQQSKVLFNLNENIEIIFNQTNEISLEEDILNLLQDNCNLDTKKCYSNVYRLDLSANQIGKFPNQLLNNLFSNLKELNLSNNLIYNLSSSKDFSQMLSRNELELIDLSNNELVQIDDEMFRNLKSLRYLNLCKNQIKFISLFAFSVDSHRLIELDLSHNMITDSSLEFLLFSSLVNLKHLNMNYNRLTSLSSHFLYNLYGLEHLSLKYNNLKTFDLFYSKNNEFLKQIDLSFNLNLKFLDQLETSSEDTSKVIISNNVETLNLAGIDLSNLNFNKFLDTLFESYKNLKHLNLSSTRIKSVIWTAKWPTSIETIDLSNNLLKDSQFDCSQFDLVTNNLKLINLSYNRLKNFVQFIDSCSNILNKQSLNKNELIIDLRNNQFENLNYLSTKFSSNTSDFCKYEPIKTKLLLGNNPLVCDCDENNWWSNIDTSYSSNLFVVKKAYCLIITDYEDLSCTSLSQNQVQNLASYNLRPASISNSNDPWQILTFQPIRNHIIAPDLFCPYKFTCSSKKCECCGFRACDCSSHCPANCRCVRDYANSLDLVNCTASNLTIIPNYFPTTTTQIRLDRNSLKRVHPYQFFGRFRLTVMDLSENQLGFIEENSFHGLTQLKVLKLSKNNLQILLGYEFKDLNQLEELYLDSNRIQFVSNLTFSNLVFLKVLNLLNNNLRHFLESKVYFEFNLNLVNLSLDNKISQEPPNASSSLLSFKASRKQTSSVKKFNENDFISIINSTLVHRHGIKPNELIQCILNKFKLTVQFEIKNNRTFRNSIGISKSLNYDDLDAKILKLVLFDRINKIKLNCEDDLNENSDINFVPKPKLVIQTLPHTDYEDKIESDNEEDTVQTSRQNSSLIVLNLNTILFGLLILILLIILFSSFLALLINKYQKKSKTSRQKTSCFKKLRKFLKSFRKKFANSIPVNKYNKPNETIAKPTHDLFMVYNKIDSDLVNKLISPILRSKPYNFKIILQHDKTKVNLKQPDCLLKTSKSCSFVLFVLSKNLFTDSEYDLAMRIPRTKKLAILADDISESLAEKLIQPGRILRGTFNLESMSFNFTSINIYDDSEDSGFVNDQILFETTVTENFYRQEKLLDRNLNKNLDLFNNKKIEF